MSKRASGWSIWTIMGWASIGLFVVIYAVGHWPSLITLVLWPILMAAYVWLALFEERQAEEEFGAEYLEYAGSTKRFIPGLA